jgi:glycosyltransferase involved in cell wall biosynthesis
VAAAAAPPAPGPRPRTVVHLITTLTQGGAERVLSEVVPLPGEVGEDGVPERHVVVSLAPCGMFADVLAARGVEVRDLGMRPGRDLFRGLRALRAVQRELAPDVVMAWMYHACLLATLARGTRGPRGGPRASDRASVVWLFRGSLHTLTGLPWHTRAIVRLLATVSRGRHRFSPNSIAVNSRTGLSHHEELGYRPRSWTLLVNGVDVETFRPDADDRSAVRSALGVPDDARLIVSVARVHPQKDHGTLLAGVDVAAALCTRERADSTLELMLIGTGTEALDGHTAGSVRVHGLGERTDVPRLLRGADITVSSSLTEGVPNALLEAMASGLPAVATAVGDCADIVGDAGCIVEPADPEALGRALAAIALLPDVQRAGLGADARARAVERYGIRRARREYRALWDPAAAARVAAERPVRVAHVIARMNVGGPARIIEGLLGGIDPTEVEQTLLTGEVGPGEEDWLHLRGIDDPRVRRVPTFGRAVDPVADLRTLRRLTTELRRLAPDVVQTHTAKAGLLGRLAARRAGVPHVVHTYHGHTLHGYFPRPVTAFFTHLERRLARRTDRLLAVGARVRDELLAAGVGRAEQYELLPPGVPEPAEVDRDAARAALGLPPDTQVVAFVGRLTAVKRPDRFLAAARTVAAVRPSTAFVLAGDGELRAEVAAAAADVPADVHLLGWRRDVDVVLAAADLVVLTSDNEGMPLTLIEAAMSGRACVTTDVGSAAEVVLDGSTGRVVAADADAVAAAVVELLDDPARLTALGAAARTHARERFGLPALVARTSALHRGLATSGR